jgi:RimJ/RimL family protein N-acetyltransferase
MKLNWGQQLIGQHVVLVPYAREFVEKYHYWMKDPYLLEMTASEPLSIEEEYEMQTSWYEDPKKCTFIVVANTEAPNDGSGGLLTTEKDLAWYLDRMSGDINLFFNDRDDPCACEVEVMIAEASRRRQGLAQESLRLIMAYGIEHLGVTRFFAKINTINTGSLILFKTLGFTEVAFVEAFQEHELALIVDDKNRNNICSFSVTSTLFDLVANVA